MSDDFAYMISRFDVSAAEEVLVERTELVRSDGVLVLSVDGQANRTLTTRDAVSAIAEEPTLSEIRANQITRITASGETFDQLPFVLSVPGGPNDFDEALWSKTLADEHTSEDWVVQPGRLRVAYVNDYRWCPFPTAEGPRMLPEAWPTVDLGPMWGHLTFCENGSMVSGKDELFIGIATERVVAACYYPDCLTDGSEQDVTLWRRSSDESDDAKLFVEWLLDWIPATWYGDDETFAQLFVEAAVNGYDGVPIEGSRLVADFRSMPSFGAYDTSEWNLRLDLPKSVVPVVLELIAKRSPRLAEIVRAAIDPKSAEGQRRRAALGEDSDDDEDLESQDDDF